MTTPDLQGMEEKAADNSYLDFTLDLYLKPKCGDYALMTRNKHQQ